MITRRKFEHSRHFTPNETKDLFRLRTYLTENCSNMGIPYDIKAHGKAVGQRIKYEFGLSFDVELATYDDGYLVTTVEGDNNELVMVISDKLESIVAPIPEWRRESLRDEEGFIDPLFGKSENDTENRA